MIRNATAQLSHLVIKTATKKKENQLQEQQQQRINVRQRRVHRFQSQVPAHATYAQRPRR